MEAQTPIIDANLIATLEKFSPLAAEHALEESRFLSHWDSMVFELDSLWDAGYQPLARLIHGFVFADWCEEVDELRYAVSELEKTGGIVSSEADEMSMRSVMLSLGKLNDIRHDRRESLCIMSELVKKAVLDGDLVARHCKPPYFPIANKNRFALGQWLDYDLARDITVTKPLWAILPNENIVVSLEQVNKWLTKIGVEVPACYQLTSDGKIASKSKEKPFNPARQARADFLIEIIKKLGYSPDSIPKSDRKIKGLVRNEATKPGQAQYFNEFTFKRLWSDMRKRGIIPG